MVSGTFPEILKQFLGRKFGELGLAGKQPVGIVYIRLMVLVMMDLHGERVDVRLQRFVRIRKRRQNVGTGRRRRARRLTQSR